MRKRLMALMLVAGGALFAETRIGIGVQVGGPAGYGPVPVAPPPVVATEYRPPCPGPGYVWIDGYYDEYQNWVPGYWALPPYEGAYWVAPRFDGGRFFAGYWGGVRNDYRNNYRFDSHERFERRQPERHEPEFRGRSEGAYRDHGRGAEHGREFERGFRR